MKTNWLQSGYIFEQGDVTAQLPLLPPGIYQVKEKPMIGQLYLIRVADKFEHPYKIYGVQNDFINRVKRTYEATTQNLGVLMTGIKGTGKSVTAQLLANEFGLPVLIFSAAHAQMSHFLSSIQQPVVVMLDEFEKTQDRRDPQILGIMDGMNNSVHRRVFLLTTNELMVNENLLNRPGRLLFLKRFNDMSAQTVAEIVDDTLIHTEHRQAIIDFVATLEKITIDIVKTIVSQVNIYNEPPAVFADILNIVRATSKPSVIEIKKNGEEVTLFENAELHPRHMTKDAEGEDFWINKQRKGTIQTVLSPNLFLVNFFKKFEIDEDGDEMPIVSEGYELKMIRLDSAYQKHFSFWAA